MLINIRPQTRLLAFFGMRQKWNASTNRNHLGMKKKKTTLMCNTNVQFFDFGLPEQSCYAIRDQASRIFFDLEYFLFQQKQIFNVACCQ